MTSISPCPNGPQASTRVVIGDVLLLRHQRVHLYLVDGGAYLRV